MTDRTITRGTHKGYNYYKVDGFTMPSPSKIKLSPVYLDQYHAEQAVDAVDDLWTELTMIPEGSTRRRLLMDAIKTNYEYAAKRGRECHRLMEALVHGEPAVVGDPDIVTDQLLARRCQTDSSILRDAEAAARALTQYQIEPVVAEQPVVNTDWWYSGTLDLIATSPVWDYAPAVFDYKFTRDVYPDMALQMSAYNHATNTIVETMDGKRAVYTLGKMPSVLRTTAYILQTRGGVSQLVPVKTDGFVWDTVTAFVESWWQWAPNKDNALSPRVGGNPDD